MNSNKLKALLYCIVLFLTPFMDKVVPILFQNQWPTPQAVLGTSVMGLVAAAVGLRAYVDGSNERAKNEETKP
jgi:hypothetical protein